MTLILQAKKKYKAINGDNVFIYATKTNLHHMRDFAIGFLDTGGIKFYHIDGRYSENYSNDLQYAEKRPYRLIQLLNIDDKTLEDEYQRIKNSLKC